MSIFIAVTKTDDAQSIAQRIQVAIWKLKRETGAENVPGWHAHWDWCPEQRGFLVYLSYDAASWTGLRPPPVLTYPAWHVDPARLREALR
jgi:hypothetical protein